jgi:adenosylhomocysteine nucleosidase
MLLSAANEVQLSDCNTDVLCLDQAPQVSSAEWGKWSHLWTMQATASGSATFEADVRHGKRSRAHAAYVNKVPFIALRSLSDLAGGGPRK